MERGAILQQESLEGKQGKGSSTQMFGLLVVMARLRVYSTLFG